MKKDIAISVQGVSKSFVLPHEKTTSIKSGVVGLFRSKGKATTQSVLKNISFEVKKGEFFGIVGRNGSGKSTLLKIISQINVPDEGKVQVNGKLTPFIELGVGFNPELSGKENLYLNGALLGFNRDEITAMYKDIVEFAELEKFMDQKLKNYSSGMQVRLAFSIAIRADSDILVLDEVLAVGDEAFQRKCFEYFATLKKRKKTVILVTHAMESVQQFCDRAILIEKGKIIESGLPTKVSEHYSELFLVANRKGDGQQIVAQNDAFEVNTDFNKNDDEINFSITLLPKKDFTDPVVGVYMSSNTGEIIWSWASDYNIPVNENKEVIIKKGKKIDLNFTLDNILPSSSFTLTLLVRRHDKSEQYARYPDVIKFDNYKVSPYDKYWNMNSRIDISYEK